jgi:hypothetical protein
MVDCLFSVLSAGLYGAKHTFWCPQLQTDWRTLLFDKISYMQTIGLAPWYTGQASTTQIPGTSQGPGPSKVFNHPVARKRVGSEHKTTQSSGGQQYSCTASVSLSQQWRGNNGAWQTTVAITLVNL